MKYLGVLLHVLQDACFGIHALEGPGGSDLFFFDRLRIGDFSPAEVLARLDCSDGSSGPAGLFGLPVFFSCAPYARHQRPGGGSAALCPLLPNGARGTQELYGDSACALEREK